MIGKLNLSGGGGIDINGVVESYVAGASSISAGDFVAFANNWSTAAATTVSAEDMAGQHLAAVKLSDNKVFVVYNQGANNSMYVYGIVCTISGTTITPGVAQRLKSSGYGFRLAAAALNDSKVFIAYGKQPNGHLYSMVCTISGTTITAGTETAIDSYFYYSAYHISVVALTDSKVFIARSSRGDYTLSATLCTISGTTISVPRDIQIGTMFDNADVSAVALNDSKVFIAYNHPVSTESTQCYLYGIVCTISGTTITAGTATALRATDWYKNTSNRISTVVLSDDKVFVAFSVSAGNLYGVICEIWGTTITPGTETNLGTGYSVTNYWHGLSLINDDVYLLFVDTNKYLSYRVCTISGTTITPGTATQCYLLETVYYPPLSSQCISSLALNNGQIFVAHSNINEYQSASTLSGTTISHPVHTVTSDSDEILGVAKTSAASGGSVDVYVPNV